MITMLQNRLGIITLFKHFYLTAFFTYYYFFGNRCFIYICLHGIYFYEYKNVF